MGSEFSRWHPHSYTLMQDTHESGDANTIVSEMCANIANVGEGTKVRCVGEILPLLPRSLQQHKGQCASPLNHCTPRYRAHCLHNGRVSEQLF